MKNKFGGPNLSPTALNQAQNEVFCHFIEFGSYVFLEIVYSDSLWQYLRSSTDKTHEKNFGNPNLDQKGTNFSFPFSQVWFLVFP